MEKFCFELIDEDVPKYIQIARNIKKLIDNNLVEDGEKLPTIRSLADFLKVNNVTIVNAYKRLQSEGYAIQKMGSGTYAKRKEVNKSFHREFSEVLKRLSQKEIKNYVDFAGETSSSKFFPVAVFKELLNKVLDRDGSDAFIYQEALGYEGLRKTISTSFWNSEIRNEAVLIVSGAQQGIDIISKSLLNVNDNIIIEKPTYSGAISVFKWRRVNIFDVTMEEDGVNIEEFENILKKNKIKFFYTMSYFQNPTSVTYSLSKKLKILQLAEKYDFYIVEDDYLSELIYSSNIEYVSFKGLDNTDRVIYIKSFSKIFLPGIRIGYVISPLKFEESLQNSKINTDISTSSLMQRALALYIQEGFWKDHINYLNSLYLKRYNFMVDSMKQLNGMVTYYLPGGGLNFYLKIQKNYNISSVNLFYECLKNKVIIAPGVLFYKNPAEGNYFFRLSFAQTSEENIDLGLKIIKKIISSHRVVN